MSTVFACMVCARPVDSLLTSGLHAGVMTMGIVVIVVIGGLARGAVRLLRDDAAEAAAPPGGAP